MNRMMATACSQPPHHTKVRDRLGRGILILAALVAGLAASGRVAEAQGIGNLTVTPTRVVFDGRDRSAVIALVNNGPDTAVYRISVINMRMTESGQFERIADQAARPGERFAEGLFRYAPRQVELAPGGTQNIRLLLRKPAGLAEGEYRSHLLIQAIPRDNAGQSVEAPVLTDGVSISLLVVPGVSLPVIVRHGALDGTGAISGMRLLPPSQPAGTARLGFRIERSGTRSLFGDLTARYFAPGKDEGLVVSRMNQLAVYTPNPARTVEMALTLPPGVSLERGGRLDLTYGTPPAEGGETIARASLTID